MSGLNDPHRRIRFADGSLPAALRPWIIDSRSLTQRICQACPGKFSLEVLHQGWEKPLRVEAMALGIGTGRSAFVREVFLLCRGRPWIFARSVIPAHTLYRGQRRLATLGTRPLGAVLFADRSMKRGDVTVYRLRPRVPLYERAATALGQHPEGAWARSSLFLVQNKPLLVSEVFLPTLTDG